MPRSPEHNGQCHQPTLNGLEAHGAPETVLEHVIVDSVPTYRKHGKGYEWECVVYCPPDIFHQERNETYEVHARTYALEAMKKRLRPGDMVTFTGSAQTQEIQLTGGETRVIHHLTVSDIQVIKRAKRESITVDEKKRGK